MSSIGNELLDSTLENGTVSKREQKKFEQMLKRIQASENPDSKSHKRRKQNHQKNNDPQARKMIKTESHVSEGKVKQSSSSVRQQSEEESKSQPKIPKRELKDLHDVYNKKYGIPEESEGLSEYMVNYTYGQKSKISQKQFEDWNSLQTLGGNKIQVKESSVDIQIASKINQKFIAEKKKAQELFSKSSKEFFKKILSEQLRI